jgi:hypothetical protein
MGTKVRATETAGGLNDYPASSLVELFIGKLLHHQWMK